MAGDERPRQPGDLALRRQPFAQRQFDPGMRDGRLAIEMQCREDGIHQRGRIARPHAQGIAGFVGQAGAFQRQFQVADVARAAAAGNALVGQQFRGQRALAAMRLRHRVRAQRHDGGKRRGVLHRSRLQ
jgi:hypothetical protein